MMAQLRSPPQVQDRAALEELLRRGHCARDGTLTLTAAAVGVLSPLDGALSVGQLCAQCSPKFYIISTLIRKSEHAVARRRKRTG